MQWRVRTDLNLGNVVGHVLVWALLTIVTCGIAAFFYPYSFIATILRSIYLEDEHGRPFARITCSTNGFADFAHGLLWFVISVLTLGVGAFFYLYYVAKEIVGRSYLVPIAAPQAAYVLPAPTG